MQLTVISAIALALLMVEEPFAGFLRGADWLTVLTAVCYPAVTAVLGRLSCRAGVRAGRGGGWEWQKTARRHHRLAAVNQVWMVGGLGLLIASGLGSFVVEGLELGKIPLGAQTALIAPFVVVLIISYIVEYPFYIHTRRNIALAQIQAGLAPKSSWPLGQYIGYNLRHQFLFIALPVGLILLAADILRLYVGPNLPEQKAEYIVPAGSLLAAVGVFLIVPELIVRIWRTSRLADQRLRERLMSVCRTMRIRCRDILIWRSGGQIVNALVMGLVGRFRYVLLSDGLLDQLDEWQIQAVFAHEAAHVAHHHIFYSVLFAISAAGTAGLAGTWIAQSAGLPEMAGQVISAGLLVAAWIWIFGFVSRRFERQSDVSAACAISGNKEAGAQTISPQGAAVFAMALQRIALSNGIPLERKSWRHGSVASRARYLLWLGSGRSTGRHIDNVVRWIKILLWISLGVTAVGGAAIHRVNLI